MLNIIKHIQKYLKSVFVFLIRVYQLCISPVFFRNSCRYTPSCSEYMKIAINKYGIIRGIYLGTKRILRCHPFGGCGHDPVP